MGRILIFGGGGFIGGNLATLGLRNGWDVVVAGSTFRSGLEGAEWRIVDVTAGDAVRVVIADVLPDVVVNLAAVASIDRAERERELAWRVNVDGARYVAQACAERDTCLISFSSGAVFDGERAAYSEDDATAPVNFYGMTKAAAERVVLAVFPRAAVIRLSLVLGFPVTGGNSFFTGLENKLRQGQEIACSVEEVRTPVDVITLSESVLELAESDFDGILHIGATDSVNRYELASAVAARMGFDQHLVVVAPAVTTPGRAPRHKNGIISVVKAQRVLSTKLLSVDEGIQRAFDDRL